MNELTDVQLLDDLRTLLAHGAARLELDAVKLNHMDSPIARESESTRWFAVLFALAAAAWWFGGWIAGAGAIAVAIAFWFLYVRSDLRRRVERRVRETALTDVQIWRKLWRYGGVRLVSDSVVCAAPGDNWMQFVRDRRPAIPASDSR